MGSLFRMGNTGSAAARAAKDPLKEAADQQQQGLDYGTGAAGTELTEVTQQKAMESGQKILNTLRMQGITSGSEWERAATMSVQGYDPAQTEQPWLASAAENLSWMDKLGATVRFGVADIFGIDTAAGVGGADGSDFGMEDFKDIWAGRFESIVARHGAEVVGEEGRMSGGQILNNIGWDTRESEDVNPFNKFMHGIAGFGIELVTDPLSYATGGLSGVGKKAALVGAEKLTGQAAAKAVANFIKGGADDLLEHAFERGFASRLRPLAKEALDKARQEAGEELSEAAVRGIVTDAARKLGDETLTEIGQHIATRSFKNMPKDFVRYADANKMSYLGGGLRITANPFGSKGVRIPGTAGRGRDLTRGVFGTSVGSTGERGFLGLKKTLGDYGESGVRGFLDKKFKAGSKWEGMLRKIGVENDMLAAFKAGKPDAAKMLRTAVGASRRAAASGVNEAFGELGVASERLGKAIRGAGLSDDEANLFFGEIVSGLHGGRLAADAVTHADEEVQAAARNFTKVWSSAFETTAEIADGVGLKFGNRENYVPFVRGEKLEDVFQEMTDKGVGIEILETMTDEERLAGELLNEMFASWQRRVRAGRTAIGQSEFMEQKLLGRTVKATDMGDTTLFEVMDDVGIEFLDPVAMNDMMTDAVQRLAEREGIYLPKDFSVLERNPFAMADKYLSSMGAAIQEQVLLDEALKAGLLKNATFRINKGRMAANVADQLKNLPASTRLALERAVEEAGEVVDKLAHQKVGPVYLRFPGDEVALDLMDTGKVKTINLGHGVTMDVPESVMDHPQVKKTLKAAEDYVKFKMKDKRVVLNEKKKMIKALKRQGIDEDLARVMADATTIEPIQQLRTSIEHAITQEAELATAAAAEVAARKVVEGKEAVKEAMGLLAARRQANRKMKAEARKKAHDAVLRTRKQAGSRPVRVARIDSQLAQGAIGDQLKPAAVARLENLAAWADQLKNGDQVAAKLREIAEFMGEARVSTVEDFDRITASLQEARRWFDTMNGDVGSRYTVSEWIDSVPKRRSPMKRTEQERLIDDLVNDPLVRTPRPPGPEITTPQELANAQQVWFAEFADMHGVDPRNLYKNDRGKLKILLSESPSKSGAAKAAHMESRNKILSIGEGIADSQSSKRSLQAMLIDIAEETGASGPGKARPEWTQFNYKAARAMKPDDFFAAYGDMFARVGTRRANGTVANEAVEAALESHKILHQAGLVGKTVDDALSGTIERDFKLLEALYSGRDVWRDVNLRNDLERLFGESSLAAEYRLTGARGGRFQLESLEEVTTLTSTQLKRELRLAGWTDSIEEAQQALARGELSVAALSRAARDTLAAIPTADARALDELSNAMAMNVTATLSGAVRSAKASAAQAVRAQKQLEKIAAHLLKRDASGNMPANSVKVVKSILDNPDHMRDIKRILPKADHPRIDQVRQTVDSVQAMRDADEIGKELIRKNNALRNDFMFDPLEARESLETTIAQIEKVRLNAGLEGAEGELATFQRVAEILQQLLGYAPDPRTGMTRPMWASAEELADEIHPLVLEGKRLSRELGWDDLTDVFVDLEKGGAVPTATTANFVPLSAFNLTGKQIDDMLIEADFGKFMEHTMRSMMALQTPTGLAGYAKGMRQVLHWWKGMATVARPTFHIRNFLSAGWNNSMIDVRMGDYKFVARHMKELQRNFKESGSWLAAARNLKDEKARFYFEQAALSGVMDTTFSNSELLGKAARRSSASKLATMNPLSSSGPLLNVGGHTMENIEGFMRLAAFIRHMPEELMGEADEYLVQSGASFANEMVNMVHFDYKNLTAAEEWVKQFVPFFVWTRRNMPLQMRTLVERPQMIARYNHLIMSANDEMASRDDVGPRRYGGQAFIATDIVMNEDTSFWSRLIIDPDIPVKDLFALENPLSPASYLNLVANMLGPHIGEPLKATFGEHYETTAPVGWQTAVRTFNALKSDNVHFSSNDRTMDSALASLLRTLFPPASEFLTAFEQDPKRMQKLGITDGDLMSRVRAGTMDLALPGLGVQGYTPQEEYGVYQSSIMGNNILNGMRKSGVIDPATQDAADAYIKQLKRNPNLDLDKFKEIWQAQNPPPVEEA